MALITDDFNRSNEDPLGGNWTPVSDTVNWTLTSNVARVEPAAGSALFSCARYDGAVLDTNDYEITVTITKDSDIAFGPGPMGRMTPTGTALADVDGYAGLAYNDAFYIVDMSGGAESSIASGGAPGAGPHTITLRIAGTNLTLIEGGVTRASGSDGTWTTGEVGMMVGNASAFQWATYENFSASDYTAPPQANYVATGTRSTTATASASLTPGLPAGWAANDIHILVIQLKSNSDPTGGLSGWTQILAQNNGTLNRLLIYWRRAVGGDAGPTITFGAITTVRSAAIHGYRGCRQGDVPVDNPAGTTWAEANATTDQTVEYNSFTPSYGYETFLAIAHVANDYTNAIAAPNGTNPTWAQRHVWETTTGSDESGALADGWRGNVDVTPVAAGTSSYTATNDLHIGAVFGLIPTGAPAVPLQLPLRQRAQVLYEQGG